MESPEDHVFRLIIGYRASRLVALAAELGLPDLIADGPKTSTALANTTGMDGAAMHRVLRGLCALGVLTEDEQGQFHPTPMSECLRSGQWAHAQARTSIEEGYASWAQLGYAVHTGKPAYEVVHGKPRWEHLAEDPDAAQRFNIAMAASARVDGKAVADAADLSRARTVVDVGGGRGGLIGAILAANPHLHGAILDLAAGLEGAPAELAAAGVADRCDLIEGSFFEAVPAGADVYLLRWILHDWDDERAARIVKVCARAMTAQSRLFLIERLMPERFQPTPSDLRLVMADLHMMVILGGRERTEAEFRNLLGGAGLQLHRRSPLPMGTWLLEAGRESAGPV